MLKARYLNLYEILSSKIDVKRMYHDSFHTFAYGADASFYRLIPELVVKVKDEQEVSFLLQETSKLQLSVTFRAAGTSLSGQSISDSILVIADEHWKSYKISENGNKIRLQPGITGKKVNQLLAPYNKKLGPDPASIDSAMIGGIAANNASGMCCGTADNSYQTVESMRIILYDGTILDTCDADSRNRFSEVHPEIIDEILFLEKSIKANSNLSRRIRKKFSIKNTMGYSLNALIDYSDPFKIIEHLMIGSEGTLGFISEITYRTVDQLPFKASAFVIFSDIINACHAAFLLKSEPVSTAELIDRTGLHSIEDEPGMPLWISKLSEDATALLIETQSASQELLIRQIYQIKKSLSTLAVEMPIHFTTIPVEYALFWKIRKGLFPSVGAVRKNGTTVIIEDIAFPLQRLAEAVHDLQVLLKKYEYYEAVIFGHALDGNLHFVFTQDFSVEKEVLRYQKFMQEIAEMVVNKYDGSLKAEHGTGRNMAPFVEMEWGTDLYKMMKTIKRIFDPENLLNPGVIINDDSKIHLKNIKPLPPAHEIIDKCIECGFCESSCVSSGLTTSPRQRIVVYREISRLQKNGSQPHIAAALINQFKYSGDETCATDGLCALTCPVKIDTGKLIKELRFHNISARQAKFAVWASDHWSLITASLRLVLSVIYFFHSILGTNLMSTLSRSMRKFSRNRIPQWSSSMPDGARKLSKCKPNPGNPLKVVYFPSCINRTMGKSNDYQEELQLTDSIMDLLTKAGYEIIFPVKINDLCCGMAFSSKGYVQAGLKKSNELESALWEASEQGKFPILSDMSPCLFTMKENMKPGLKLYEPVEFILEYLIQKLEITKTNETISIIPVCSMKKMGLESKLIHLAEMCAKNVVIPETNCCGFAGDRGFTFPELNAHGLRNLKIETPGSVKNGYSNSRTCEIGFSLHSGISYKSIVYLVNKVSKSKN